MASLNRQEAEDILFEEARLLDARRYDEWFAMLTEDAIYWVPCNGEGIDPNREISLVYDDHARLHDRIDRLNSGVAHAQSPPSKTCRLISNVQIQQASVDRAAITSAFFLYELRQSRQRVFAGHYEHRLRLHGERWKIEFKKACL
jgi:benzoate/toluate 1,2-dioxygenase beta subunit